MTRDDLEDIVLEAVRTLGGSASIVQVARYIWDNYEDQLRRSDDLFFTWQYDMRWAAQRLRDRGVFKAKSISPGRQWELS